MEIKKASINSQRGKNWFVENNGEVLFTTATKADAEKSILVFNETGIFALSVKDAKMAKFKLGNSTEDCAVYYNLFNGDTVSVMAKNFKEAKAKLNEQYPEITPLQILSVGVLIF